ncbi:unnamed protein product [Calypogeia fissa]
MAAATLDCSLLWREAAAAQRSCVHPTKPSNCHIMKNRSRNMQVVWKFCQRNGNLSLSVCGRRDRDQRPNGGEKRPSGFMLAVSCSLDNAASSNFDQVVDAVGEKKVGDVISRDSAGDAELVSGANSNGVYVAEADKAQTSGGGDDNGRGGFGGGDGNGGGDGAGDGGEERNRDEEEFGPILNAEQVQQEIQGRGVTLPADMLEAAQTMGIRQLLLSRYIELQGAPWPLGPAIRGSALLRNRMLADPTFLFKVLTEVAIDSGCATFAEVQKRGKDFWNEFELYLSDLSVGIVLDVALVGLLAPFVKFGAVSTTAGGTRARLSRAIQALPSSIFEAQRPGRVFSLQQRIATLFYKAGQYGVAGFLCGTVGQGLASGVMTLKRKLRKTEEEEVAVPSIVKSAALWAVFMGVSSNTRYQIINGLERVVEGSIISKRVPLVALGFTVGIRFANNIYGGMQFVDWARLAGVQ